MTVEFSEKTCEKCGEEFTPQFNQLERHCLLCILDSPKGLRYRMAKYPQTHEELLKAMENIAPAR